MKSVVIFKNDRIGDLFTSTFAINRILKKHNNDKLLFYFSNVNYKFSFLFPKIKKKKVSMKLSISEKISILFFFIFNKIDTVYILKPKNFYFILAFLFRKIKFYGITINSHNKKRPSKFLAKYLYRKVEIDRTKLKKRLSTYTIQESLIENININNSTYENKLDIKNIFKLPKNYIFFHYKNKLFNNSLNWNLDKTSNFINFLSTFSENLIFSSEIFDNEINNFFGSKYTTFNYLNHQITKKENKKIIFLKDIDGENLFDAIRGSDIVVAPEGLASHIAFYLKKKQLALMHFNFKNKNDYKDQMIACKEWFPPNNFNFTVLKKDFEKSITKVKYRLLNK